MTRRFLLLALAALTGASAVTLPRPAEDLKFITPTGPVLLSQYRGKVTVIAFALSNCEDCHKLMGLFNSIQKDLGPRGFQAIVGVFNIESTKGLGPLLSSFQPSYPMGMIQSESVVAFTQVTPEMKPTAPIMVIVDRKGMIRAQFLGSDKIFRGNANANLRAEFEKYLK